MTTQITLFDTPPADMPERSAPVMLFDQVNRQAGHLLIESEVGDWLFLNHGGDTIRCCLPGWDTAVDLTSADLRVLGDYCHRMAERIETRTDKREGVSNDEYSPGEC